MTDWDTVAAGDTDQDTALREDVMIAIRDRAAYLYERAMRTGTATSGNRIGLAYGGVSNWTVTTSSGRGSSVLSASTFSGAASGNPSFTSAPTIYFGLLEGGANSWEAAGEKAVVSAHIQEGSLSTTGLTIEIVVESSADKTYQGTVYWFAVGIVGATAGTNWIDVNNASIDAESPNSEDRWFEMRDNLTHVRERTGQMGDASLRHCFARGRKSFSIATGFGSQIGSTTAAVTFSTDSDDGDPNFDSSNPPLTMVMGLHEDTSGSGVDWQSSQIIASAYVESSAGGLTDTGFTIAITARSQNTDETIEGYVDWAVWGEPSTGE